VKPRHRSDDVATEIVEMLREAGCRVVPFESPFPGEPDYLAGRLGVLTLLELKSASGRLSDAQRLSHDWWARVGVKVAVVRTPREALEAVGVTGPKAEENLRAMRLFVAERRRETLRGRLQSAVRRPTEPTC
jgi:hypothetical protein